MAPRERGTGKDSSHGCPTRPAPKGRRSFFGPRWEIVPSHDRWTRLSTRLGVAPGRRPYCPPATTSPTTHTAPPALRMACWSCIAAPATSVIWTERPERSPTSARCSRPKYGTGRTSASPRVVVGIEDRRSSARSSGSLGVRSGLAARRSSCSEVSHVAPPERSSASTHP